MGELLILRTKIVGIFLNDLRLVIYRSEIYIRQLSSHQKKLLKHNIFSIKLSLAILNIIFFVINILDIYTRIAFNDNE